MTRYITFLRAINVGGHVVKMEFLRKLFEDLGFTAVETFIASGNVMFEADIQDTRLLENRIAAHLHTNLGYQVAAFFRTAPELAEIAHYQPFPSEINRPGTLYIGFLAQPLDQASQEKLMVFCSPMDDFHFYQKEIYWWCRVRSTDSEFSLAKLEKRLGIQATFRNRNTIQKLAARFSA